MTHLRLGRRHLGGAACAVLVAASATWAAVPVSSPGPSTPFGAVFAPFGAASTPSTTAPPIATPPATAEPTTEPGRTPATTPATPPTTDAAPAPVVPAALTPPGLDLRAGPVPVALELRLPSLDVAAEVLGVGITEDDVMDAPSGARGDVVWLQAFWYRGSAVPGAASTAVVAGHVGGPRGSPGSFGRLHELTAGDPIVVHDTRTGQDVRFTVDATATYTLAEAAEPAVLARIYGTGPATGRAPQPSADGLGHLTLITCAGTFRGTTHDQRLAVYATRAT